MQIPCTPRLCFTELKLSESRAHAKRYGRLGIGVKRPYIFNRHGGPVAYYGYGQQIAKGLFLKACVNDFTDKRQLHFFKPMNSELAMKQQQHDGTPLPYDLYSESEWRILFSQDLLDQRLIIDPRDSKNEKEYAFFKSLTDYQQETLRYLAPLDGWLAMIIYPTLGIKKEAQQGQSTKIREEIYRIKNNMNDHANKVEGGDWPMEIELGACRHF